MNPSITIKVLSYNIHKGFSVGNRSFVLGGIRDAIRVLGVDIVFLQEVQGQHDLWAQKIDNWPSVSQFEYLADEVWPHYAYGKNVVYDEGHHGNAILSKFPINSWENIDISSHAFESRGLLHSVIEIPDLSRTVHLLCVHLGLFKRGREFQIEEICSRIESHVPNSQPLIMAGDFNDRKESASDILEARIGVREVFRNSHGQHPKTYPSWFPWFRLDRVYGRGVTVAETRVLKGAPWNKLSDHLALYAELTI